MQGDVWNLNALQMLVVVDGGLIKGVFEELITVELLSGALESVSLAQLPLRLAESDAAWAAAGADGDTEVEHPPELAAVARRKRLAEVEFARLRVAQIAAPGAAPAAMAAYPPNGGHACCCSIKGDFRVTGNPASACASVTADKSRPANAWA